MMFTFDESTRSLVLNLLGTFLLLLGSIFSLVSHLRWPLKSDLYFSDTYSKQTTRRISLSSPLKFKCGWFAVTPVELAEP